MNVTSRQPMTVAQFLAWEERQVLRYEFDGIQAIAMTGGTAAHAAVQVNLLSALVVRLRGKPCRPYGSELKIAVAGGIRYPDAFVICSPVPPRATVVGDPVVVFEVLSDSGTHHDFVVKNAEYRATPSILRYVVLQQTHAGATVFVRKGEDWVTELHAGLDAVMAMPEIGIGIPLADIYGDVAFAPESGEPA